MTRKSRRLLVLGLVLAAASIAAVSYAYASAADYRPLRAVAYAPGVGFSPKPTLNDEGEVDLHIDGYRHRFGIVDVVVRNDGRWRVRIERSVSRPCLDRTPPANGDGWCAGFDGLRDGSGGKFAPVELAPGARTTLHLRYSGFCWGIKDAGSTFYAVRLVYRYLGVFERGQEVGLPFSPSFTC
jgi:hypothetical protein